MDWSHQVSTEWLKARRDVVTATELVDLKSGFTKLTKAQKAGTDVAPAFAALWGKKHSIMEPDPNSFGEAARGHCLEPYAVEDYNDATGGKWYHWDDCIICNNGLGFSPDAMDIMQSPYAGVRCDVVKGKLMSGIATYADLPTSILEVKSYGIANHMRNMVTKKESLKERYQIAVAMMVLPSITEGRLVQYNPQLSEYSMFDKVYTRTDLEPEIEELSEILDIWNKTCRWFDANVSPMEAGHDEFSIIDDYIEMSGGQTLGFKRDR